jgi:hypothetical protein
MIPKFNQYEKGLGAELVCPSCDSNYLHHAQVEVFECGEDAEYGVHVVVTEGKAEFNTSLDGNPSRRRHGLKIRFWCESCKAEPVMSISQHKGNTFVEFE